jgi:ubiquitin-protein ligase E3 C
MYSFEGDYRRKPQQNLAGASRRDEKNALLQHAHLERLKREQQRNKHNATVKIQAHVRSFIIRQSIKRQERFEFDKMQQVIGINQMSIFELIPFIKQLLFFYTYKYDGTRLIWVLQHVLKLHKEIKLYFSSTSEWIWRIR